MLRVALRIRVSDGASSSFMIIIHLNYHPDEILPYEVVLELEGDFDSLLFSLCFNVVMNV